MWGKYISQFPDYEIAGNKLLYEKCEENEYLSEINFLIDLIEKQLPRDYKYFLNKDCPINSKFSTILKTYKEFLILNKGFCNCIVTSDIKIPPKIKTLNETELKNLNDIIQNAIEEKNIDKLLNYCEILF